MARIVIKYGGNAIEDLNSLDVFAGAVRFYHEQGNEVVVVHGGGPQIKYWLEKTGIESHFIDGQRYTDNAALSIVEMALCGQVNKALVRAILREGLLAVGISGEDAGILQAIANHALGAVGNIEKINSQLIDMLLGNHYIPIISPVAINETASSALNINADYATAHIAGVLKADRCLFLTNVDGLLDSNKKLIQKTNFAQIQAFIADGTINGGMIPKIECALKALQLGVGSVSIVNGTRLDSIRDPSMGTQILT